MKTILFTAIVCCLIVAVDAQTLVTQRLKENKKHTTETKNASSEKEMKDMDARFFAAE